MLVTTTACYLVAHALLGLSPVVGAAVGVLTGTFFMGGVVFPVLMALLQSPTATARGTVSALASVLVYAGSAIAGIVGGPLMAALPGFWGISLLALAAMAGSLILWTISGATRV